MFKFKPFSKNQLKLLSWWTNASPKKEADYIVASGSIRSGKTLIMSLSYVLWGMQQYNNMNFGMAGKTISSFYRNVWIMLKMILKLRGYTIIKAPDLHDAFIIKKGATENTYYIFGGKDEASQDLVQGLTLAGFLFDEVTLMPKSFVEQATARCSVDGSKWWFNCNPKGPNHWFKLKYIDEIKKLNGYYLHFKLTDNLSLSKEIINRYHNLYTGVFYQRYILGEWVLADGLIYPNFKDKFILNSLPKGIRFISRTITIDYGHTNATVFYDIAIGSDNKIYILNEYHHAGYTSETEAEAGEIKQQKSPLQYAKDLQNFLTKISGTGYLLNYKSIIVDPSAKGFMLQCAEIGLKKIQPAINDVAIGIELINSLIDNELLYVMSSCSNMINEFKLYSWDKKKQELGIDAPSKKNDHSMDALRYFVNGNYKLLQSFIDFKIQKEMLQDNRLKLINKNRI